MALAKAYATDRVTLLGFTKPRMFEGGKGVDEKSGREFTYNAGVSMRVCVGSDSVIGDDGLPSLDFDILKVKTDFTTAVYAQIRGLQRGDELEITFIPPGSGRPGELVGVQLASDADAELSGSKRKRHDSGVTADSAPAA